MTDSPIPKEAKYRPVTLANFKELPQLETLPPAALKAIRVVGSVLPFKSNTYVVDKLIDWRDPLNDPIFILNFPQKDMLHPDDYRSMEKLLDEGASPKEVRCQADQIRLKLNPHPAGQLQHNVPAHHGKRLKGMQHKYRETVLFFPAQGQTCHAYCTFCFRWVQFAGMEGYKIASQESGLLAEYLKEHPYVTDVLITGGDPLIMRTKLLEAYIEPLLKIKSVRTIRIGTKSLSYWPYRFLTDPDARSLLALFSRVGDKGKNLAIMAHFNHWREMTTPEVPEAIHRVRVTGAQIRTQSPILRHINDDAGVWAKMWQMQVELSMIPYYMFIARDTGSKRFFELPLADSHRIFMLAYRKVSGLGRTVRGPCMSATPGKVRLMGVAHIKGEKVFALNLLQGRNTDWSGRPFFAKYDPEATWLDDLKPAFGEREFFYEAELRRMLQKDAAAWPPELQESEENAI